MVVVNAMEGEPASLKDRTMLTVAPHLVIDGAEVAAAATGASEIVFCIANGNDTAAASIGHALGERKAAGIVRIKTSIQQLPGRYVAGEESALVSWLNKRRSLPTLRLDKSVPLEVSGRQTIVHNAETLSQVALIARHGSDWFRQLGTDDAPGSTLVTVSGAVGSPQVLEVEFGEPVIDILRMAGVGTDLAGVLLGGYGGAWLAAGDLDTPYAPGPIAAMGSTVGVGVIVALPASSCGIAETARIVRYMAGQSAGQCGPCVFGLPALATDIGQLAVGRSDGNLLARLLEHADAADGRGACRHPDGVARLVRSALVVFSDDAADHAAGRPCPGNRTKSVMAFPSILSVRRAS
jgi:NADH:ubiquinone oxidoreductase subunit F (NADH-binding)